MQASLQEIWELRIAALGELIHQKLDRAGHRNLRGPELATSSRDDVSWFIHNEQFDLIVELKKKNDDMIFSIVTLSESKFAEQSHLAAGGRDLAKHWKQFQNGINFDQILANLGTPPKPLTALQKLIRERGRS